MNQQLGLDAAPKTEAALPFPERRFPYLGRDEVWWWDVDARGGGRRAYHRGQIRTGPEYAYIWPFARWGTVAEAEALGYFECDVCIPCEDAVKRRRSAASRGSRRSG